MRLISPSLLNFSMTTQNKIPRNRRKKGPSIKEMPDYILTWNNLAPTLTDRYADMSLLKSWQTQEKVIKAYTAELEKQREENKKDRLAEQKGLDEQIEAVRKKYYGTDKWLKAPNGKDTNLTEGQWLQVRTENFKKWFGDWKKNQE